MHLYNSKVVSLKVCLHTAAATQLEDPFLLERERLYAARISPPSSERKPPPTDPDGIDSIWCLQQRVPCQVEDLCRAAGIAEARADAKLAGIKPSKHKQPIAQSAEAEPSATGSARAQGLSLLEPGQSCLLCCLKHDEDPKQSEPDVIRSPWDQLLSDHGAIAIVARPPHQSDPPTQRQPNSGSVGLQLERVFLPEPATVSIWIHCLKRAAAAVILKQGKAMHALQRVEAGESH